MKRLLAALFVLFWATPAVAQTLIFEGSDLAVCNSAGNGADCTSAASGTFAQQIVADTAGQVYNVAGNTITAERGFATAGATLATIQARKASVIAAKAPSGRTVLFLSLDGSDLGSYTAQQYIDGVVAYVTDLKANGFRVIVSTIPTRSGIDQAKRKVINKFYRQQRWLQFDEVADFGADDDIGADAAIANSASFWTNGTTLSATGHTRAKNIALPPIRSIFANVTAGWTVGAQPRTYTNTTVVGLQLDIHPEVSSSDQGGDPPALLYEPFPINEKAAGYVRTDYAGASNPANRIDAGEGKFRTLCSDTHENRTDPILAKGNPNGSHRHSWVGNKNGNELSNYLTARAEPWSTCGGGPLNATYYWRPSVLKTLPSGVAAAIKSDFINFYYTISPYSVTPSLYRLLRDLQFIGGVNPNDTSNSIPNSFVPSGQSWLPIGTGWAGWQCYGNNATVNVRADLGGGQTYPALQAPDGSDPWGGLCVAGYQLGAIINGPDCWDGVNLRTPDGRSHVAYSTRKTDNSITRKCPDGWFKMPHLEGKEWFSHNGWADYSTWYLSSDRMDPNPANWKTPGSTFHFDWINGWDDWASFQWMKWCAGVTINGDPGQPLTCDFSLISPTWQMTQGTVPNTNFSPSPIVQSATRYNLPNTQRFLPIPSGTVADLTIQHDHN